MSFPKTNNKIFNKGCCSNTNEGRMVRKSSLPGGHRTSGKHGLGSKTYRKWGPKQANNRKRPKLRTIPLGRASFSLLVPSHRPLDHRTGPSPGLHFSIYFILIMFLKFFDDIIPNSPRKLQDTCFSSVWPSSQVMVPFTTLPSLSPEEQLFGQSPTTDLRKQTQRSVLPSGDLGNTHTRTHTHNENER